MKYHENEKEKQRINAMLPFHQLISNFPFVSVAAVPRTGFLVVLFIGNLYAIGAIFTAPTDRQTDRQVARSINTAALACSLFHQRDPNQAIHVRTKARCWLDVWESVLLGVICVLECT